MRDTLIFHCPYNFQSVEYGLRICQELGLELVSPDAIWREEAARIASHNSDEFRFSLTNEELQNSEVQNVLFQGYGRLVLDEFPGPGILLVNFPTSKATYSQFQGVMAQVGARYRVVLLLSSPEYAARKLATELLANLDETVAGLLSNKKEIPSVFSQYGIENERQLTAKIHDRMLHRARLQSYSVSQNCQYWEEMYRDCPNCLVLKDTENEDEVVARIGGFWQSEWL